MRRLLVTIVSVAVPPVALCAQTATSPDVTLAQQVVREIMEVKGGTTPAQWLQAHAEEKLQIFNGPEFANDTQQWCARTVVAHTTLGHAWTRAVYFYDPQPPADDALPAPGVSGRKVLETTCQLGLIWIDIPEGNPAVGRKLSEDIQAALESQYGSGSAAPQFGPGGFGSAGWTCAKQWHVDGAVLTVAYDQFKDEAHRAVVRLAFANSDAIHDLVKETEQSRKDLMTEIDELTRKVKETGLPAAATTEITTLLRKPDYLGGQNLPNDTQVVAAFDDWLITAKSRPPGQQAIALLVADRVLEFLDHNRVPLGDAARETMKSLGVNYVHNELAGADVYAHGLLKEAKAMVPRGYAADEVLLAQMEHGFDETGMCSAGAEEFSQVIQQGEAILAGARTLPVPTLSSLHFMIGDAYATIVWLATTGTEYHDPKKYMPMAESSRAKALEHYRAAFHLERGTARAQKAWKDAWRLATGLPPTSGRYFCVYD